MVGESSSRLRVAVVIPCHNDGRFVSDAVDSLRHQEPHELVIVDDGSADDETLEVLDDLARSGIRVLHQEHTGVARARMAGVRATRAPYVLPLDADDRLAPKAISVLADALEAHPGVQLAWGDVRTFGARNHVVRTAPRLDPWRITHLNELPQALVARGALEAVGGWDESSGYEDWDLWMKLAERGFDGVHVSMVTYHHRRHSEARRRRTSERRHAEEYELLRSRHPTLFAERRVTWRRSPSGVIVKAAFPLVARCPGVSQLRKMQFLYVVRNFAEPVMKSPEFPGPGALMRRAAVAGMRGVAGLARAAGRPASRATHP